MQSGKIRPHKAEHKGQNGQTSRTQGKTTKSVHTKPKGHNHQNRVRPKNKNAKVIIDKIILTGIIKKEQKGLNL